MTSLFTCCSACEAGHNDIVMHLIINFHAPGLPCQLAPHATPLHAACQNGHLTVVLVSSHLTLSSLSPLLSLCLSLSLSLSLSLPLSLSPLPLSLLFVSSPFLSSYPRLKWLTLLTSSMKGWHSSHFFSRFF